MLKKSYFMTLLLAAVAVTGGKAQDASELVASQFNVNKDSQYHVFIKTYSQTLLDYLQEHPRITVDFTTDNSSVVTVGGAWFKGVKEGTANMTMDIYAESSIKDYPDFNNKLESIPFTVTVQSPDVKAPLPYCTINWGELRSVAIEDMVANGGYELFTDRYVEMNPTITEDEKSTFDVYYTGDMEYPLAFTMYNDDGQLYSSDIVVANGTRLGYYEESEISDYLVSEGYELLGYDEMGLLILYNESEITQVSAGFITLQGQYFRYLSFQYETEKPGTGDGIDKTYKPCPDARIDRRNGAVEINTDAYAGKGITIYDMSGRVVAKGSLHNGSNTISVPKGSPVIVKIDGCAAVKAM